jgi:hypothetical protein
MKSKEYWKYEINIGIFAMAVALIFAGLVQTIPPKRPAATSSILEANFMPKMIAVLMAVAAFMVLYSAVTKYKACKNADVDATLKKHPIVLTKSKIVILCVYLAYLILLPVFGYILDTTLLSFTLLMYVNKWQWKERGIRNAIFSFLFTGVTFVSFRFLLQVLVPVGILFGGTW